MLSKIIASKLSNIYFSHKRRGFDYQTLYAAIRKSELNQKYNIILPHEDRETAFKSKPMFKAGAIQVILAEVSQDATGLGLELGWADILGIPIICLFSKGAKKSGSLVELDNKHFLEYENFDDLLVQIETILNSINIMPQSKHIFNDKLQEYEKFLDDFELCDRFFDPAKLFSQTVQNEINYLIEMAKYMDRDNLAKFLLQKETVNSYLYITGKLSNILANLCMETISPAMATLDPRFIKHLQDMQFWLMHIKESNGFIIGYETHRYISSGI
ncbi:MAG: hypothetical protein PHV30_11580 [Candidatus Margulisbacteria bacterium]|nr:hypothetical protein [Candidatus Margulisiibacteriota bacterium]